MFYSYTAWTWTIIFFSVYLMVLRNDPIFTEQVSDQGKHIISKTITNSMTTQKKTQKYINFQVNTE
jgi:hypothetical protein